MPTPAFTATYEIVRSGEAIVTLFHGGEWSGAGRVSIRSASKAALYEAAYLDASARAACKGGSLSRFSEEA